MNDLTLTTPRLPVPEGVNPDEWLVLTEAIFPNAQTARGILLALKWCRARGLDIMKRPVNVVPVWNSALGKTVEGIWPSITEVEITASRSKEWAGMDEPKFGPMISQAFEGKRKDRRQGWIDAKVEVTFPEFCSVTVYRMVNGQRCAFTEPVWWLEAYGRVGGSKLPNDVWTKRPRGQLIKVAKAFSLRAAFPEEGGGPTAEEMQGQTIEPPSGPPAPPDNWQPPKQVEARPAAAKGGNSGDLDRAGAGEDAPMTEKYGGGTAPNMENVDQHQRAASEDDGPPDDDAPPQGDVIDPETGEVLEEAGPHPIEHGDIEPWRDWCARFMLLVRKETELPIVEKWVEKNKKTIEQLVKDAPKVHAQLMAAVGKHRVTLLGDQNAK